jgi:hypothetical protein
MAMSSLGCHFYAVGIDTQLSLWGCNGDIMGYTTNEYMEMILKWSWGVLELAWELGVAATAHL